MQAAYERVACLTSTAASSGWNLVSRGQSRLQHSSSLHSHRLHMYKSKPPIGDGTTFTMATSGADVNLCSAVTCLRRITEGGAWMTGEHADT